MYAAEPHLGPGALAGLTVPDESIICTWTVTLAFATEAVNRGAELLLGHAVRAIEVGDVATVVRTSRGELDDALGRQRGRPRAATSSTGCSATSASRSRLARAS